MAPDRPPNEVALARTVGLLELAAEELQTVDETTAHLHGYAAVIQAISELAKAELVATVHERLGDEAILAELGLQS